VSDPVAEVEIGEQARKFVDSELGKAMLDLADRELKQAQELLETVDPADEKKVRALQNKAQIARNFGEWLVELIDRGENALIEWSQSKNAQS
jgi:hypothetical protein